MTPATRRRTRLNSPLKNAALVRGLIYPVQFERNPPNGIARVLDLVVNDSAMDATPKEFLAAVREALASDEVLSKLIPQDHSEDVIRLYLTALAEAIEQR